MTFSAFLTGRTKKIKYKNKTRGWLPRGIGCQNKGV